MKQDRVVTLTVLTFVMFGLTTLFSQGSFVVPVPFIAEFMFFLCLFIFLEGLKSTSSTIELALIGLFGVLSVLASPFIYELMLSPNQMLGLSESILFDAFKFLRAFILLFFAIWIIKMNSNKFLRAGLLLFLILECFEFFGISELYFFGIKAYLGVLLTIYHLLDLNFDNRSNLEYVLKGYGLLNLFAFISTLLA